MRLFKIPDGLLTNADRTFWLMPPFDMKIEGLIIACGIVSIIARISGLLDIELRIGGDVKNESRIGGKLESELRIDGNINNEPRIDGKVKLT